MLFRSDQIMSATGSILTNKYAEGYPGKRYYGGCQVVDKIESLAISRAMELFGACWANVQPHSGSQANSAVFFACLNPGDKILGFDLSHGGHLTHGSSVNFSGKLYNPVFYGVDKNTGMLDYDDIERIAKEETPKMIIAGASAYSRDIDFKRFRKIADSVDALLLADISHPSGLIAKGILNDPAMVETSPQNTTVEAIVQYVYNVDKNKKSSLIIQLIKEGKWKQVLVFTRTKHGANNLCKKMIKADISAAAIHGNKSQGARTRALAGFKDGSVEILVATDIAARGLDIPLLPHVINFELPNIPEDYVHRIGRTGRAGAKGEAISLVCIDEKQYLKDIEKLVNLRIPSKIKQGFEPDPNAVPEPTKQKNRNSFNRNKGRSNRNKKRNTYRK